MHPRRISLFSHESEIGLRVRVFFECFLVQIFRHCTFVAAEWEFESRGVCLFHQPFVFGVRH
jgi:hypothetical protein